MVPPPSDPPDSLDPADSEPLSVGDAASAHGPDAPTAGATPAAGAPVGGGGGRRRLESVIPDLIKRAVERGVEKATEAPDSLKQLVSEMKLPKEIAQTILTQVDETKNGLFRVVAKEIRDFLEHTNIAAEAKKMLTSVQFEVNTTVRFTPNEGSVAPQVTVRTQPSRPSAPPPSPTSPAGDATDDRGRPAPSGDRPGAPPPGASSSTGGLNETKRSAGPPIESASATGERSGIFSPSGSDPRLRDRRRDRG
jgi:hypothetical protein